MKSGGGDTGLRRKRKEIGIAQTQNYMLPLLCIYIEPQTVLIPYS